MNETKSKGGRPKSEIDFGVVERLAGIDCTEPEISAVLGISYSTWKRHKKADPQLSEAVIRGRYIGKMSLRRLQWETALGGNPAMQIWLGKQRLGQSDKQQIEQHQVEQLVIVTDRANKRTNGSVHESSEVSGTGSGEKIRKDISRTH
tara:strand:+ start:260 stop:703 length:444 start_codon:yes stop_codon:yes gene_type:complete